MEISISVRNMISKKSDILLFTDEAMGRVEAVAWSVHGFYRSAGPLTATTHGL